MICPDCKGSKVYQGLNTLPEPCHLCKGTGEVSDYSDRGLPANLVHSLPAQLDDSQVLIQVTADDIRAVYKYTMADAAPYGALPIPKTQHTRHCTIPLRYTGQTVAYTSGWATREHGGSILDCPYCDPPQSPQREAWWCGWSDRDEREKVNP